MKCAKCKVRITAHLWIVGDKTYCSPRCERGRDSKDNDKYVEKFGVHFK